MKMIKISVLAACSILMLGVAGCAPKPKASIVLKNAVVQTMVKEGETAQAVAVQGDAIVYVGDNNGAESWIGSDTQVIDLAGKMLIPGFMDGHIHAPGSWKSRLFGISLEGMSTNKEYLAAIKKYVDGHPEKSVYFGEPFMLNDYILPDGSIPGPQKSDLDAISKDKPIIIYDIAHHSIWTNSKGLEIGGVTKDTPTPQGGSIAKDKNGEPSGYLTDSAAALVTEKVDLSITPEMEAEVISEFQKEANSMGITGITNIVGALSGEKNDSSSYIKLAKDGKLTLRMRIVNTIKPGVKPEDAVRIIKDTQKADTDMVKGGTAKFFADGVTESGTAVMLQPYLESVGMGKDWRGEPVWDWQEFNAVVSALDKAGIQVHTHVIGDGAVNKTLDSYAAAQGANGKRDARHTITHVCAITPEDVKRVADLNVVSAIQFLWLYADELYELEKTFIGKERALAMYPIKDMVKAGAVISGASDAPVTPYNPLDEIEVGVTRNCPYPGLEDTDMRRAPEQALTAYQMLEAYTKNAAYQNFMEKDVGTIEVGKKADITVLSQNILAVDPKRISEAEVLYTISNGKVVYQK